VRAEYPNQLDYNGFGMSAENILIWCLCFLTNFFFVENAEKYFLLKTIFGDWLIQKIATSTVAMVSDDEKQLATLGSSSSELW
jgi:hypothetical protein